MKRAKADGFYLIADNNLDRAMTDIKTKGVATGVICNQIATFFQSLKKHEYRKGPYGTGDFFIPEP